MFKTKAGDVKGVKVLITTFESKEQLNTFADYVKSLAEPASGIFYNDSGQYAVTASSAAMSKGIQPREAIAVFEQRIRWQGGGRDYFTQGACAKQLTEELMISTIMPY